MILESSGVDKIDVSECPGADVLSGVETENQWGSGRKSPLKRMTKQSRKQKLV